jgi:hypothetical protein
MGTDFIEQALSEADQMEFDRLKSNSDILRIIAHSNSQIETLDVGGVSVRFQAFISFKKRREMQALKKPTADSEMEESEGFIYSTLALLCMDEPYTKAVTWKIIHRMGGDVEGYLADIMGRIAERAAQMQDFRNRRGRKVPV